VPAFILQVYTKTSFSAWSQAAMRTIQNDNWRIFIL